MKNNIKNKYEAWLENTIRVSLTKSVERKHAFKTDSEIEIERLYVPDEIDYENELGFPGKYPFTRGVYPTMYRGRLWTMRQYAGFGTAEETNERFHFLLKQGTTGLSVAFDLPTQIGYDSDHPIAEGEVGKVGVAIDSLEDMETLFKGIELQKVSTSMTINATAAILLCMYVAIAKKQNADLKKISGTIQNDILKEYIARGTYIYPPEPSMRLVTDIFSWCSKNLPRWNTISISGYHIREAGADAVQEVAFTLSNGIAYVQAAVNAGLDIDSFGSQLSFFFNSHNNFFEEIAKFRAARRMWAKIMRNRFQAKNPESMKMRFHAQTAGSTLTAQQVDNNVVRVTLQALAAVLGGCQSLHTNSRDEALSLPTEASVQLALRTQQIIAFESGVADTIDPIGGSYFIENLTDEIEKRASEYISKIDSLGGAVRAVEQRFYQNEIAHRSYEYQKAVEAKEKIIVGVNEFKTQEDSKPEIMHIDLSIREKQTRKLNQLKQKRDNQLVENNIKKLKNAAMSTDNIIPFILEAVESYATLGEISDALRSVWGEYREN